MLSIGDLASTLPLFLASVSVAIGAWRGRSAKTAPRVLFWLSVIAALIVALIIWTASYPVDVIVAARWIRADYFEALSVWVFAGLLSVIAFSSGAWLGAWGRSGTVQGYFTTLLVLLLVILFFAFSTVFVFELHCSQTFGESPLSCTLE